MPAEARGVGSSGSWTYRRYGPLDLGSWELNLGPLQRWYVLLTAALTPQPPRE